MSAPQRESSASSAESVFPAEFSGPSNERTIRAPVDTVYSSDKNTSSIGCPVSVAMACRSVFAFCVCRSDCAGAGASVSASAMAGCTMTSTFLLRFAEAVVVGEKRAVLVDEREIDPVVVAVDEADELAVAERERLCEAVAVAVADTLDDAESVPVDEADDVDDFDATAEGDDTSVVRADLVRDAEAVTEEDADALEVCVLVEVDELVTTVVPVRAYGIVAVAERTETGVPVEAREPTLVDVPTTLPDWATDGDGTVLSDKTE